MTPPTAPPAIAPVFDFDSLLLVLAGAGVGVTTTVRVTITPLSVNTIGVVTGSIVVAGAADVVVGTVIMVEEGGSVYDIC